MPQHGFSVRHFQSMRDIEKKSRFYTKEAILVDWTDEEDRRKGFMEREEVLATNRENPISVKILIPAKDPICSVSEYNLVDVFCKVEQVGDPNIPQHNGAML